MEFFSRVTRYFLFKMSKCTIDIESIELKDAKITQTIAIFATAALQSVRGFVSCGRLDVRILAAYSVFMNFDNSTVQKFVLFFSKRCAEIRFISNAVYIEDIQYFDHEYGIIFTRKRYFLLKMSKCTIDIKSTEL